MGGGAARKSRTPCAAVFNQFTRRLLSTSTVARHVAQFGRALDYNPKTAGSNPVVSTDKLSNFKMDKAS